MRGQHVHRVTTAARRNARIEAAGENGVSSEMARKNHILTPSAMRIGWSENLSAYLLVERKKPHVVACGWRLAAVRQYAQQCRKCGKRHILLSRHKRNQACA